MQNLNKLTWEIIPISAFLVILGRDRNHFDEVIKKLGKQLTEKMEADSPVGG